MSKKSPERNTEEPSRELRDELEKLRQENQRLKILNATLKDAKRTEQEAPPELSLPGMGPATLEELVRLFTVSLDLICIADITTASFVRVNPAFTRVLGYEEHEIEGHRFSEFIHPDEIEETDRVVAEELAAGKSVLNFYNRYRCKDGSYRWLSWHSRPFPETGLTYAVARDITEAKETEERYRTLYEAMNEGIALHELVRDSQGNVVDYRITDVNSSFEKITGIPREKAVDALASELYNTTPPPYLEQYAAVAQGGPFTSFEVFFEPMDLHFRISVFSPGSDQFATIFENVTDMIKAQEELRASLRELSNTKALLDAVVEQAPIPMVVVGSPDMVVRIGNSACRELLGLENEYSLRGINLRTELQKTWQDYDLDGNLIPMEQSPLAHALHGQATKGKELRVVRKDGTERWVVVFGAPIYNDQGELIAGLISFPDITELKKTQQLIVQTEKMMSVGGLAAGMAHEINNPLAGIIGAAQIITRRLSPDFPSNVEVSHELGITLDKVLEYLRERGVIRMLEGITQSASRAAAIVKNMLEFSRQSESNKAHLNVNELLEKVVALACQDYDPKGKYDFRRITIIRELAEDLPDIPLTRTEIEQVFLNLLRNAAQAVATIAEPEEPRITLRTTLEEDHVRVEIADNGPGMDKEMLHRVFEPFYTTKSPGSGTGLGLSISYFIITKNHRGIIEVESAPGKGSTFIIKLPLALGRTIRNPSDE